MENRYIDYMEVSESPEFMVSYMAECVQYWGKLDQSMMKLEHTAIMNEDDYLLREGEESFGKKLKASLAKAWQTFINWLAKVRAKWSEMINRALAFLTGKRFDSIKSELNKQQGRSIVLKKEEEVDIGKIQMADEAKANFASINKALQSSSNASFNEMLSHLKDFSVDYDKKSKVKMITKITASELEMVRKYLQAANGRVKDITQVENWFRKAFNKLKKASEDEKEIQSARHALVDIQKKCNTAVQKVNGANHACMMILKTVMMRVKNRKYEDGVNGGSSSSSNSGGSSSSSTNDSSFGGYLGGSTSSSNSSSTNNSSFGGYLGGSTSSSNSSSFGSNHPNRQSPVYQISQSDEEKINEIKDSIHKLPSSSKKEIEKVLDNVQTVVNSSMKNSTKEKEVNKLIKKAETKAKQAKKNNSNAQGQEIGKQYVQDGKNPEDAYHSGQVRKAQNGSFGHKANGQQRAMSDVEKQSRSYNAGVKKGAEDEINSSRHGYGKGSRGTKSNDKLGKQANQTAKDIHAERIKANMKKAHPNWDDAKINKEYKNKKTRAKYSESYNILDAFMFD